VLKHRKRISIFTLTIFMLTLLFAGLTPTFAAAKTAPGSAPAAQAPASSSSDKDGRPNRVSPEGDAVKNSISQGPKLNAKIIPTLEKLEVYNGETKLADYTNPGALNEITVPKDCSAVGLFLDPKVDLGAYIIFPERTDTIIVEADSSWAKHEYSINHDSDTIITNLTIPSNFAMPGPVAWKEPGEKLNVTITLINNDAGLEWGDSDQFKVYTLKVHRADLELYLDEESAPIAADREILMSDKNHTLKAVYGPEGVSYDYEWTVEALAGSQDCVSTPPASGSEYIVDPNPDQAGTAKVTVKLKQGSTVLAQDSCIIHVGKIDIWVEEEDPDFYRNGRYEASFGYSSTFPRGVSVNIPATGDLLENVLDCRGNANNFWGSGEAISGVQPAVFEPGVHHNEFRVKYFEGAQIWFVAFENTKSYAVANTFQSIRLDRKCKIMGLDEEFTLNATPSFEGNNKALVNCEYQREINWQVLWETDEGVVDLHTRPNSFTCQVEAGKPGWAVVMVSIKDDEIEKPNEQYEKRPCIRKFDLCLVTVMDNRTLTLDQEQLTLKKGRVAQLNALIDYEELQFGGSYDNSFLVPENWNEVKWGFVAQDNEGRPYIVDSSELGTLTASGQNMTLGEFKALGKGATTVVAYLGYNFFSERAFKKPDIPKEFVSEVETLCRDFKLYLDWIPEDRYDTCLINIKSSRRPEEEPKKVTTSPPVTPPPTVLETLDVTITVGSNQALVNDQQVTLSGNTLLIGEDRAMVDYGDISKLIPGVAVAWDWQTQAVTFTKGDKSVTMKLDEIPANFDVPFMNIGGRLVVPVRYVGGFFGATVDWIGNTLVVHMYK